jgi:hypothetical protein
MTTASRASLEQEIYLRSLTGYLVGRNLLEGHKRVAVITYPDRICSAMAAALMTSYLSSGNYRDAAGAVFTYDEGKEVETARKVADYGADIVYISFGGEQKMSYVAEITRKIINALADAGYRGALGIHVRTWLATKQLSSVLADKKLADYLSSLPEIRLFTADVPNRKFLFHRVKIEGGAAKLEKYREVEITEEHAKLLTISLPPPE